MDSKSKTVVSLIVVGLVLIVIGVCGEWRRILDERQAVRDARDRHDFDSLYYTVMKARRQGKELIAAPREEHDDGDGPLIFLDKFDAPEVYGALPNNPLFFDQKHNTQKAWEELAKQDPYFRSPVKTK